MVCSPNVLVRYPNVVVSWLWLALALDHQRQNLDHEGQDPNLDLVDLYLDEMLSLLLDKLGPGYGYVTRSRR